MSQEQRANDFCRAQADAQMAYIEAERRVNQLKAENASLKGAAQGLGDLCDQLKAENAKLRELLSEVAKLVTNPAGGCLKPGCALGCPHHLECNEELGTCFYVDRIRDLGIEVD